MLFKSENFFIVYVAALVFYYMFLFWCKHRIWIYWIYLDLFLDLALLHFTDNAFLLGYLFCFLQIEGLWQS